MGLSEIMRREFYVAYGTETHQTFTYSLLVLCIFVTVHVAFNSHHHTDAD